MLLGNHPQLQALVYILVRLFLWGLIVVSFFFSPSTPQFELLRLIGLIVGVEGMILLTLYANKRKDLL